MIRESSGVDMKIGIVMPILNQQKLALEAYASMRSRFDLEFFPINNWEYGYSVAQSWNVGMLRAMNKGCGLVIFANDDILVSKYAIDRMVVAFYENPNLALVTGTDHHWTVSPEDIIEYRAELPEGEDAIAPGADYAFFMLRPGAYVEIGGFDENFRPAYFEDNDYARRIELSRWDSYQLRTAAFYHYGSTTQNSGNTPICTSPMFEANRDYFKKKWGGEPSQERFIEPFDGVYKEYGLPL